MARDHLGKLRRSAVVGVYGPGAIVDFRAPGKRGSPVSGVIAGLEEWDRAAPPGHAGVQHSQKIQEPRLQKRLHVRGFRLPPVRLEEQEDSYDIIPIVRFPEWQQCPRCNRLEQARRCKSDPGNPELLCRHCSEGAEVSPMIPVRLVVACDQGHLDEFPWRAWASCKCTTPRLVLKNDGPGLAGKVVACQNPECEGKPRSLDSVFGKNALSERGYSCRGHRPWLAEVPVPDCDANPRVLQRGASNVYYGASLSALDIPPFSTDLGQVFGIYADTIQDADEADWEELIRLLKLEEKTGKPKAVLLNALRDWKGVLDRDADIPLEWDEYQQFSRACGEPVEDNEFHVLPENVPAEFTPWLSGVALAERLREVRALVGFTRITPPSGPFSDAQRQSLTRLYARDVGWLPAVELRGEGIFIRFQQARVEAWEKRPAVVARMAELATAVRDDLAEEEVMPDCSPRFLLLHSFAHALMRQLSLECGYSSSSLRERLFVGTGATDMIGVMVHTGSPGADGTLGGLVRQGRQDLLAATIDAALMDMSWCSSDPLCVTGAVTLSSARNAAACHACLLVPETSCQHFNTILDRATLIGTPEEPDVGYFSDFMSGRS